MKASIPAALQKWITGCGYFIVDHIVALRYYCLGTGFFVLVGMLGRELNEWVTGPKLTTIATELLATSMPTSGPEPIGPDRQGFDGLVLVIAVFLFLGAYLALSLYQSWSRNSRRPAELTSALATFLVLSSWLLRALRPPNLTVGLTALTIASVVITLLCVLMPWFWNRVERKRDKQFPPEAHLAKYKQSRQP